LRPYLGGQGQRGFLQGSNGAIAGTSADASRVKS